MSEHIYGDSKYKRLMREKQDRYSVLTYEAEVLQRDNHGVPTVEEANKYREAVAICEEIIQMNLGEAFIVSNWEQKRDLCQREVNRILAIFVKEKNKAKNEAAYSAQTDAPDKAPKQSEPNRSATDGQGFTTKNATDEVKFEWIKSWHQPKPDHSLEELSGMDAQTALLLRNLNLLYYAKSAEALNAKPILGFFLYGPPGSGKTYLVEALASKLMEEEGFKFLQVRGKDMHQSYVGVGEKVVEAAFKEAMDNAPCLLFIDEVEEVCVSRSAQNNEGHSARLLVSFLEMFTALKNSKKHVIFLGATNYPDKVDEAMMDRIVRVPVPLPDAKTRKDFFRKQLAALPLEEGFSYEEMADLTDNNSFRDMEHAISDITNTVLDQAIKDYQVLKDGRVDRKATDSEAEKAIRSGKYVLTREMFKTAYRNFPPSNKSEIRAGLEAFERKVAKTEAG